MTYATNDPINLFSKHATTLKDLYNYHAMDATYRLDVNGYIGDLNLPCRSQGLAGTGTVGTDQLIAVQEGLNGAGTRCSADLSSIDDVPQLLADQDFFDLDRIIAFDDGCMFTAALDSLVGHG